MMAYIMFFYAEKECEMRNKMIEYKFTDDTEYSQKILHTLRSYNRTFTGGVEPESLYIYVVRKDKLVGALKVGYFWDWVSVGDAFYEDTDILKTLMQEAWKYYGKKAIGIKLFTPVKSRYDDFVRVGFEPITVVKNMGNSDYYYADLHTFDYHEHNDHIISDSEPIQTYQEILEAETKAFKAQHNINGCQDTIQIVALNQGEFVGGVQGEVYDGSLYISRIAVLETYRHKAVGKTLMLKAIDEAKRRDLSVVELGTCDFQAKGFYDKLGFSVVHTRLDSPRGYNAYTMLKRL